MALTDIDKNLAIASMESALETARTAAGVETLATVERLVRQLRRMVNANPTATSESLIKRAWTMLDSLAGMPSINNIGRISRYLRDITPAFVPWTPPVVPGGSGTGVFDGSTLFDGSTTFSGSGSGASGTFDGSATFDGSKRFDGS